MNLKKKEIIFHPINIGMFCCTEIINELIIVIIILGR
jgi:hypothetical protein